MAVDASDVVGNLLASVFPVENCKTATEFLPRTRLFIVSNPAQIT